MTFEDWFRATYAKLFVDVEAAMRDAQDLRAAWEAGYAANTESQGG